MTRKTTFFEGWSWFKLNNLGLALGTNLKFYTSFSKGLKLKVGNSYVCRKCRGKTGSGGGGGFLPPPSWIGLDSGTSVFSTIFKNIYKGLFLNGFFESIEINLERTDETTIARSWELSSPAEQQISTAWKVSVFRVFLVCIFPHSDWIRIRTRKNSECGHFFRSEDSHYDKFNHLRLICKFLLTLTHSLRLAALLKWILPSKFTVSQNSCFLENS